MSETNNRNLRDYSKYDSMSTEQLQEILRLDAHQNEGNGMDTDELFYIMEVLTVRRKSNPETAGKTVQEARKDFQEHYMPKDDTETAPVSKRRVVFPAWLRRAATVAAVLAIFLVVATTSVNAFGYDLWGKVAIWSQEFFHFEDETMGTEDNDLGKQDIGEYSSLQEALDKAMITEKLVPTWLPNGFELIDLLVFDSPREVSISAKYICGDAEIRISIRQLIGSKPEEIEKSEGYILAYDANGITYYIFENNSNLQATWVVGEFECIIGGSITIEEMKAIIDSI